MSRKVMRLGEIIMLPASNMDNKFVKYIVVGKEKGGVYHLKAESIFVYPQKRTIVRATNERKAA